MQSIVSKQELMLEITSSSQIAHLAPCPLCWAGPREPCKFGDRKTPAKYIPEYHWVRLERYERHMPGVARSVYLREIAQLNMLDLMAIFFRRLEFKQNSLKNYHINASVSREELITILLPTGRRAWTGFLNLPRAEVLPLPVSN